MSLIKSILHKIVNLIPLRLRTKIKKLPLLATLQRTLINRFMNNDSFVHKLNAGPAKGLVFNITLPWDKNIWTGTYEFDFSTILAREISKDSVCYDIGGFKGFMSGIMALNGASQVYTFEPLKENYEKIQELIKLNPSLHISVFEYAVGSIDGLINFDVSEDPSMNKIENSLFHNETGVKEKRNVQIFKLDTLINKMGFKPPDVIKIDVEGAEYEVINGAHSSLKQFKPKLLIEVHGYNIGKMILPKLKKYGYNIICSETNKLPDFVSEPSICHYICK